MKPGIFLWQGLANLKEIPAVIGLSCLHCSLDDSGSIGATI
jgi:hypothetical protein